MSTETPSEPKTRQRGEGRTFKRGARFWWIAYCIDGKEYRESAKTDDCHKAEKLLARRLFEAEEGKAPVSAKERRRSVVGANGNHQEKCLLHYARPRLV